MKANDYTFTVKSIGRKWITVTVKGKKSLYEAKVLLDSLPGVKTGETRTVHAIFVDNSDKYGRKYELQIVSDEKAKLLEEESKKAEIERWWGYIKSSFEQGRVYQKGIDKIHELGSTEYDEQIKRFQEDLKQKKTSSDTERWWGYIKDHFSEGYIYEKGVNKLHELGCTKYDEEIQKMRQELQRKYKMFAFPADKDARNYIDRPAVGSLLLKDNKAYKVISCRYNSTDGWSFGALSEAWYAVKCKDVTATCEGREFIAEQKEIMASAARRNVNKMLAAQVMDALINRLKQTEYLYRGTPRTVEGEVVTDTLNIYGGGYRILIETVDGARQNIWYIINNGADGDDWSLNNICTGGAGAYGYYSPYTDEYKSLVSTYRSAVEKQKKEGAQADDA